MSWLKVAYWVVAAPHKRLHAVPLPRREWGGQLDNGGNVVGAGPTAAAQRIDQPLLRERLDLCAWKRRLSYVFCIRGTWGYFIRHLRLPSLLREYSFKFADQLCAGEELKFVTVLQRSCSQKPKIACLMRNQVVGGPRKRFQLVQDNVSKRLTNAASRAIQSVNPLLVLVKACHRLLLSHWLGLLQNWTHGPGTLQQVRRSREAALASAFDTRGAAALQIQEKLQFDPALAVPACWYHLISAVRVQVVGSQNPGSESRSRKGPRHQTRFDR